MRHVQVCAICGRDETDSHGRFAARSIESFPGRSTSLAPWIRWACDFCMRTRTERPATKPKEESDDRKPEAAEVN